MALWNDDRMEVREKASQDLAKCGWYDQTAAAQSGQRIAS